MKKERLITWTIFVGGLAAAYLGWRLAPLENQPEIPPAPTATLPAITPTPSATPKPEIPNMPYTKADSAKNTDHCAYLNDPSHSGVYNPQYPVGDSFDELTNNARNISGTNPGTNPPDLAFFRSPDGKHAGIIGAVDWDKFKDLLENGFLFCPIESWNK